MITRRDAFEPDPRLGSINYRTNNSLLSPSEVERMFMLPLRDAAWRLIVREVASYAQRCTADHKIHEKVCSPAEP